MDYTTCVYGLVVYDVYICISKFNLFAPKSDKCEISPAASPEILKHSMKNMALIIAPQMKEDFIPPILATSFIRSLFIMLGECNFCS